jgi:antitoxin MazE
MKAQIIQIGNSQGIRIPKILLEESRLSGDVELEVCEDGILIRRASKPRGNWDMAFRALADTDDDQALDAKAPSAFDSKEWQW